jgi:hypothetical protein
MFGLPVLAFVALVLVYLALAGVAKAVCLSLPPSMRKILGVSTPWSFEVMCLLWPIPASLVLLSCVVFYFLKGLPKEVGRG